MRPPPLQELPYIAEKLPNGGKVAVVSSEAGSDVIQQRDRGFENELKNMISLNL